MEIDPFGGADSEGTGLLDGVAVAIDPFDGGAVSDGAATVPGLVEGVAVEIDPFDDGTATEGATVPGLIVGVSVVFS